MEILFQWAQFFSVSSVTIPEWTWKLQISCRCYFNKVFWKGQVYWPLWKRTVIGCLQFQALPRLQTMKITEIKLLFSKHSTGDLLWENMPLCPVQNILIWYGWRHQLEVFIWPEKENQDLTIKSARLKKLCSISSTILPKIRSIDWTMLKK